MPEGAELLGVLCVCYICRSPCLCGLVGSGTFTLEPSLFRWLIVLNCFLIFKS